MAYTLKAFYVIGSMVNNASGSVAPLGELSSFSLTFSKEHGFYTNPVTPSNTLVTFSSKKNDADIIIPGGFTDHIQTVMTKLMGIADNHGVTQYTRSDLLLELADALELEATAIDCGAVISSNTVWLPQYIQWTALDLPEDDNRITIWLSDAAFRGQYDEYEIAVIPPLANLEDFFLDAASIRAKLAAVTADDLTDRVQAAKLDKPETMVRWQNFKYVDPVNPLNTIDTVWTILNYGPAGDNPDAINDAFVEHALANSTKTRSQWQTIFPDIFKRTEFLVLPGWWRQAIEQPVPAAGIYSAIINLSADITELKNWVSAAMPEYTALQLNRAMATLTHNYRCLNVTFIGSIDNRENKFLISDWYSDYIPVSTTSIDFSRMSANTCKWANMLTEALIFAETWTESSTLPSNLRRLKRNGINFLVFAHNGINFLIYPANQSPYAP